MHCPSWRALLWALNYVVGQLWRCQTRARNWGTEQFPCWSSEWKQQNLVKVIRSEANGWNENREWSRTLLCCIVLVLLLLHSTHLPMPSLFSFSNLLLVLDFGSTLGNVRRLFSTPYERKSASPQYLASFYLIMLSKALSLRLDWFKFDKLHLFTAKAVRHTNGGT